MRPGRCGVAHAGPRLVQHQDGLRNESISFGPSTHPFRDCSPMHTTCDIVRRRPICRNRADHLPCWHDPPVRCARIASRTGGLCATHVRYDLEAGRSTTGFCRSRDDRHGSVHDPRWLRRDRAHHLRTQRDDREITEAMVKEARVRGANSLLLLRCSTETSGGTVVDGSVIMSGATTLRGVAVLCDPAAARSGC